MAVVPFGGGSSVVGGVDPVAGDCELVIALDLRRLDRVLAVDRTSLTARARGGACSGPSCERRLAAEGVTLGHFPQSFEFSTVGGWVATRSAGQASTGYGRIDELVEGLTLIAPAGEAAGRAVPATAAGRTCASSTSGSEGVLGVISEATLRVRPLPAVRRYEGWSFRSFAEGHEALRVMEQAGAVARRGAAVRRGGDAPVVRHELQRQLAGAARAGATCACAATRAAAWRSSASRATRRTSSAGACTPAALLRAGGGVALGRRPGEAWQRGRYHGPYVRDTLLGLGVFVETLETRHGVEQPPGPLRGGDAARCGARCRSAGRRRS